MFALPFEGCGVKRNKEIALHLNPMTATVFCSALSLNRRFNVVFEARAIMPSSCAVQPMRSNMPLLKIVRFGGLAKIWLVAQVHVHKISRQLVLRGGFMQLMENAWRRLRATFVA